MGAQRRLMGIALLLAFAALPLATGCVTVAEHRKLERRVADMHRGQRGGGTPQERLADLAARLESLDESLRQLQGRLEVTEHRVDEALREARAARADAASPGAQPGEGASPDGRGTAPASADGNGGASADEVAAYRVAYAAWRSEDTGACVDRFRDFLQTYPASAYADDSAYWLADCYFKQGDYKTAVLRFDDVVSRYPSGNKAADALYRQGEALLRLGPKFGKAASKAFERVLTEYPDSGRAVEAKQQLDLLGSG
jgi:tol-pal system protein YbgF